MKIAVSFTVYFDRKMSSQCFDGKCKFHFCAEEKKAFLIGTSESQFHPPRLLREKRDTALKCRLSLPHKPSPVFFRFLFNEIADWIGNISCHFRPEHSLFSYCKGYFDRVRDQI